MLTPADSTTAFATNCVMHPSRRHQDLPYVPSGPPPTAAELVARCLEMQNELLWIRHDRRGRRRASHCVREVWHLMGYMAGRRHVPDQPIRPEQLLRLRPEEAAGRAIESLAVAIQWAQRRIGSAA